LEGKNDLTTHSMIHQKEKCTDDDDNFYMYTRDDVLHIDTLGRHK